MWWKKELLVDVVVGLQYGSEGKGKVVGSIANLYDGCMRVQSIQAGHTVWFKGVEYKMRTIPCAWVNRDCYLYVGPGAFIERELLKYEVEMLPFDVRDRLLVDYRATFVEERHSKSEEDIVKKIGSTGEGAGAALVEKLMRRGEAKQARDDLAFFNQIGVAVGDTISHMHDQCKYVLIEGCQGTLLGVHTAKTYPYCTSRECGASAILGECGISPLDVRNVIGVFRSYPIRVGGHSGDTGAQEITWDEVTHRSGAPQLLQEYTTVTKRLRRIFEFSYGDMIHSLAINKPNVMCLTFADYIDWNARKEGLTVELLKWLDEFQQKTDYRVHYVGYDEIHYEWRDHVSIGRHQQ